MITFDKLIQAVQTYLALMSDILSFIYIILFIVFLLNIFFISLLGQYENLIQQLQEQLKEERNKGMAHKQEQVMKIYSKYNFLLGC